MKESRFNRLARMSVLLAITLSMAEPSRASAQFPLPSVRDSGQTVTPAFEGWYRNPDGTFSLSFGYFNRNTREALDIPIGPYNAVEPGEANQGQPTRFGPGRNWGVFAVTVPADFGDKRKVVWTVKVRGGTFAIPGSLNPNWEIDALNGQATTGNTPPVLRFTEGAPIGQGPKGVTVGPLEARVGQPLRLRALITDDAKGWLGGDGGIQPPSPITVWWLAHQGAGRVTFLPDRAQLSTSGGTAETSVTFAQSGEYVVRVRVNDGPVGVSGHVQCCWTNGFVKIRVSP